MKTSESSQGHPTEAVFHSMLRTWGLMRQVQEPYFARFGVSGAQWGVLRVLQRAELAGDKSLTLTEVGARLFIQPPSVTGVVDRLERLGLVDRVRCENDRRARQLSLTPRARKLMSRVLKGHADRIESLFAPLSVSERKTLFALMKKMEASLNAMARAEHAGPAGEDGGDLPLG